MSSVLLHCVLSGGGWRVTPLLFSGNFIDHGRVCSSEPVWCGHKTESSLISMWLVFSGNHPALRVPHWLGTGLTFRGVGEAAPKVDRGTGQMGCGAGGQRSRTGGSGSEEAEVREERPRAAGRGGSQPTDVVQGRGGTQQGQDTGTSCRPQNQRKPPMTFTYNFTVNEKIVDITHNLFLYCTGSETQV